MSDIKKTLETKQNNNNVSPYPSTSDKHGYHGFEMANSESESLNPNNIYNNIQNSGNDNQLNVVSNIEDFEMSDGKDSPENFNALKAKNAALRIELKSLNDQLTILLSKKKYKPEFPKIVNHASPNHQDSEKILQMELENAKKQLTIYQKEWRHFKQKCQEFDDPTRLPEIENKVSEIEDKIAKETQANKALTKEIRDKNKVIDSLQNNTIQNPKEAVLGDGVEAMKKKLRLVKSKEERLRAQSESKDEYIAKLENELVKLRESYRIAVEATGYSEEREKEKSAKRLKAFSVSRLRANPSKMLEKNAQITSWRIQADTFEDLMFNAENFEKVQSALRVLEKSDIVKDRTRNREMQKLRADLIVAENEKEESSVMLAEKEKEVETLNATFQELNAILLQNNLKITSPLKREPRKKKVPSNMQSASERDSTDGISLSSNNRVNKDKKPKPTVVGEFNDTDLIGEKKVKICGVRVWHDGKKLNGIQAIYKQTDGTMIKGKKHVEDPYKYKAVKFDMEEDDYLKDVTGFISNEEDAVQSLVFRSAKDQVRRVGNAGEEAKQFKFDISENEFPAIIYGTVKNGPEGSVLVRVGILIASDEDGEEELAPENSGNFFDITAVPSEKFKKANKANTKKALES